MSSCPGTWMLPSQWPDGPAATCADETPGSAENEEGTQNTRECVATHDRSVLVRTRSRSLQRDTAGVRNRFPAVAKPRECGTTFTSLATGFNRKRRVPGWHALSDCHRLTMPRTIRPRSHGVTEARRRTEIDSGVSQAPTTFEPPRVNRMAAPIRRRRPAPRPPPCVSVPPRLRGCISLHSTAGSQPSPVDEQCEERTRDPPESSRSGLMQRPRTLSAAAAWTAESSHRFSRYLGVSSDISPPTARPDRLTRHPRASGSEWSADRDPR